MALSKSPTPSNPTRMFGKTSSTQVGSYFPVVRPHIENVRELHVVGCFLEGGSGLRYIHAAMPNLVSISFQYEGPSVFGLLIPTDPSSLPFPHLERVMVLGPESGLREVVTTRRDCGVPLQTLVLGWFEFDREDHDALREFVDGLRIACPTEILGWGTENETLNTWARKSKPEADDTGLTPSCSAFSLSPADS